MTSTSLQGPEEMTGATAPPPGPPVRTGTLPDAAAIVREFNAANAAHEHLWTRVLHAGDLVRGRVDKAAEKEAAAGDASGAHLTVQAEHPHRSAPRLRQLVFAAITVALDAVACYFAAQAVGDAQPETLAWAALFLAVLGGGEVALDFYRERHQKVWWALVTGLAVFIAGLGVLRFWYLATVGTNGVFAALIAASLFTVATAGFVALGYRALQAAETSRAWKARRAARRAARAAEAAQRAVRREAGERDRLADAYMSRIRSRLLRDCSASQLPRLEAAVRAHLLGQEAK